jgi:NADH-quinone oxidoreductase subunit E
MSVRRLAPLEIQPSSFAFSPDNDAWVDQQIAKYPPGRQASAVLPLLWRAQEQAGGWVSQAAIEAVATRLGMAKIRVLEIATFYSMFNLEPVGRYFVQLCGTTPCGLRGAGEIRKVLKERIGDERHVTADGLFSWLEVECLGACCNAPMVQINQDYYEDLTPESMGKLLDDLAAGRPVEAGSQTGRVGSEPAGGPNTLTDPALYDGSVVGSWRKRFEEDAAKKREAAAAAPPAPAKAAAPAAPPAAAAPPAPAKAAAPAVPPVSVAPPTKPADKLPAEPAKAAAPPAPPASDPAPAKPPAHPAVSAAGQADRDKVPVSRPREPAGRAGPVNPPTAPAGGPVASNVGALRVSDEHKPPSLPSAREAGPDDLKRIRGVGPKLEIMLHGMGIFHFDQIAQWSEMNLRWVDQNLGSFRGRAVRDDWIAQAKALAAGARGGTAKP